MVSRGAGGVVLCECGCGGAAPLATATNKKWAHVKGKPVRFIHGHHRRRPLPLISRDNLLWLAGLLEGEGSFITGFRRRKPKYGDEWKQPHVRVTVNMTDEDVIAKAAGVMGASYHCSHPKQERRKAKYCTQISGPNAEELMSLLYEFLGSRRKAQIDLAKSRVKEGQRNAPTWPRSRKTPLTIARSPDITSIS